MLAAYAPAVPPTTVEKLSRAFGKLRDLAETSQPSLREEARVAYPYSARELVKVVRHVQKYPDDGVDAALADVFALDAHVRKSASGSARNCMGRIILTSS